MKIYKTQKEVDADIRDNVLIVNEDVTFEFSLKIEASLKIAGNIIAREINAWNIIAGNIIALNINAGNIIALNINALNINAGNIIALNINALNINAGNINALDINARDINALDINARDINAWNINFYAVCSAYVGFICKSIKSRRENGKYFCLDKEVEIRTDKEVNLSGKTVEVKIDGKEYKAILQ